MSPETHKVLLKPLEERHSEQMFQWINDRELVEFNASFKNVSREDHDLWFENILKDPSVAIFAIELDNGQFIGSCQLNSILPKSSAEIQIRIGAAGQGRGHGTETIRLLLKYGFEDLDLHRIYIRAFESNKRSIRMFEKCLFKLEGTLREHTLINGEYKNVVVMGLLKREFLDG